MTGIDKDSRKVATLEDGRLPIYEPGLLELVLRNRRESRLTFTTDLASVATAQLIFIAVGTPQAPDGAADLSNLWAVADALASLRPDHRRVIVETYYRGCSVAEAAAPLAPSAEALTELAAGR